MVQFRYNDMVRYITEIITKNICDWLYYKLWFLALNNGIFIHNIRNIWRRY